MNHSTALPERLDIVYHTTSQVSAKVDVRIPGFVPEDDMQLVGHVRGPLSELGSTLPTTIPLQPLAAESSTLRASIADPCFWSPDTPLRYETRVELRQGSEVQGSWSQEFGIRALQVRQRSLLLGDRRWVLRAAMCVPSGLPTAAQWHLAATAGVVEHPEEDFCAEASRYGMMLVADLADLQSEAALRSICGWPAVGIAILPSSTDSDPQTAIPNVLRGQWFDETSNVQPASWCQIVIGTVVDPAHFARQFAECKLPVVAARRYDGAASVRALRAECDRLQRDLAPYGDFAGYLV